MSEIKQDPTESKSTKSIKPIKACAKCAVCDPTVQASNFAEMKAYERSRYPHQNNYGPWVQKWQEHRKIIENIKPRIDQSFPTVPRELVIQKQKTDLTGKLFQKITTENALLVRRIAEIYSNRGRIDNRFEKPLKSIKNRGLERQNKAINMIYQNCILHERIKNIKPSISRKEHSSWYEKQEKIMEFRSLYPLHFKPKPCPPGFRKVVEDSMENPRQFAYLQIEVEDQLVSNLIIELYADLCPFTVRNFRKLCTSGKDECECLSYRCKKIDKLISIPTPNGKYERAYWQVGTMVDAYPKYSRYIIKESNKMKHTEAGYLTKPKGIATGEFYITMGPAPYLEDTCYIFGRLVGNGLDFLKKVQEVNIDNQGNPNKPLHITDCGVAESEEAVAPAMLMREFINRVKEDILPLLAEED